MYTMLDFSPYYYVEFTYTVYFSTIQRNNTYKLKLNQMTQCTETNSKADIN